MSHHKNTPSLRSSAQNRFGWVRLLGQKALRLRCTLAQSRRVPFTRHFLLLTRLLGKRKSANADTPRHQRRYQPVYSHIFGAVVLALGLATFLIPVGNVKSLQLFLPQALAKTKPGDSTIHKVVPQTFSHPFTRILSKGDTIRYRYLFDAVGVQKWSHMDKMITHLDNPVLQGLVLYDKLVDTTSYQASSRELGSWLESYGNHPEAYRIKKIAAQNRNGALFSVSVRRTINPAYRSTPFPLSIEFFPERVSRWASASNDIFSITATGSRQQLQLASTDEQTVTLGKSSNDIELNSGLANHYDGQEALFSSRAMVIPESELDNLSAYSWQIEHFDTQTSLKDLRLTSNIKTRGSLHRLIKRALYRGQSKRALSLYKRSMSMDIDTRQLTAIKASMTEGLTLLRHYNDVQDILLNMEEHEQREQPLALWWAALSAYALEDYKLSENLLVRHARSAALPSAQQARSWYWAARAATKNNNPALATQYLRSAAQNPIFTLYGYLARRTLGDNSQMNWQALWPRIEEISNQHLLRRVLALIEIGESRRADEHLAFSIPTTASANELAAYASFAEILRLPMASFRSAWNLFAYHGVFYPRALYPLPFWSSDIASHSNVDPLLSLAIVRQESAFHYRAISGSGARGLMQLMPYTASDVSGRSNDSKLRQDLFTISENIKWGNEYLDYLLDDKVFSGSIIHSIAAYNGGPARIKRHYAHEDSLLFLETISPSETRNYVNYVFVNYLIYKERMKVSTDSIVHDIANSRYPKRVNTSLDGHALQ